ncbi:hypothetical protein LC593_35260 [Nostoc sp. CHAB 5844]|nr:hypothetical protein [Nostoc sp. CHAB 5844]
MPQITTTEQLTAVEINFYAHEIYCRQKLIARIVYDHNDFVTEPWVVEINNQEVFRRSAWLRCYDDISWHYKRGTLPVQSEETPAATTGNEVMARIAQACEHLGYDLLDDGIYFNDVRLVEIVYKNGTYHYVQSLPSQQEVRSDCVDLFDKPFDLITAQEWLILAEYEPVQELVAA